MMTNIYIRAKYYSWSITFVNNIGHSLRSKQMCVHEVINIYFTVADNRAALRGVSLFVENHANLEAAFDLADFLLLDTLDASRRVNL